MLTYLLLGIYGVGRIRSWGLLGRTASNLSWLMRSGEGFLGPAHNDATQHQRNK